MLSFLDFDTAVNAARNLDPAGGGRVAGLFVGQNVDNVATFAPMPGQSVVVTTPHLGYEWRCNLGGNRRQCGR